jgi:spore germination protein YaaH
MSKIFFSVFLLLLLILAVLLSINFFYEAPLFSAINQNSKLRYFKELIIPKKEQKVVYGFLPYWNITAFNLEKELSHLAFFGLDIGSDGQLQSRDRTGNLEPGYRHLQSEAFLELAQSAQAQGTRVELVLKQFNNQDISTFLSSKSAVTNFLTSLDSVLLAYPITGINIDIEYSGEKVPELRQGMTDFMATLRQHLDSKYQDITLSIDVYASSASDEKGLWDLPALAAEVDYIVVMAYDFHQRSSDQAGPVAPLFSQDLKWGSDINAHLKLFLDQVPREKILLGIPFYGYGWQTDAQEARANTYEDTGFTVSYKKAKELLAIANGGTSPEAVWAGVSQIKQGFDADALSPYVNYQQDGHFYTIYYENPQSIAYKLEYARQLDLAGIAIWALGYEDQEREIWEVIAEGI